MDINLLIISIIGLSASGICFAVGIWLFRKEVRKKVTEIIEKLPSLPSLPKGEEPKPEPTLLDMSKKLEEFEEKTT